MIIDIRQFILLVIASVGISSVSFSEEVLNNAATPTAEQLEFFERSVRPLLAEHCYSCHSSKAEKLKANLLVDSRAGLLRGGDSGAAIVPGDADGSLIIAAIRYENYEMPPKGKLPAKDIETFEKWIEMGAPWPNESAPVANPSRRILTYRQEKLSIGFGSPSLPQTSPKPRILSGREMIWIVLS